MTTNDDITSKTLAQKLALCADILRDCVAEGLHFATNTYEQNR